jgi:hypothetical protein
MGQETTEAPIVALLELSMRTAIGIANAGRVSAQLKKVGEKRT